VPLGAAKTIRETNPKTAAMPPRLRFMASPLRPRYAALQ
jgi:hypothetical protein